MTRTSLLLVAGFLGAGLTAEPLRCLCDPARPETLEARECSLCREAEIFFLKDTNPRKPNRWLALPRAHSKGLGSLVDLTLRQRTRLWAAAIKKAKELWGDQWGLAYNGDKVRTQCHLHIHIGKLLRGIETRKKLVVVDGPAQIPKPKDGEGIWVHPHGRKLHVHLGEQTCETVLLR
jgi:diadenosine tetraphosphate (Ap4A) HIT family hydrolase